MTKKTQTRKILNTSDGGSVMSEEINYLSAGRTAFIGSLAFALAMGAPSAAIAAITNTATATGTPSRGTLTDPTDSASVGVETVTQSLNVVKTVDNVTVANGTDGSNIDGSDVITYRYVITNDGTGTLTNVTPVDSGPTFNGTAGDNALSAFTHLSADPSNTSGVTPASVAPGETVVFEATYTLSTEDALLGAQVADGVDNSATGTSDETPSSNTSTAETNIPENPLLDIAKTSVLTQTNGDLSDGLAAVGDTIVYTYTVENTGNVAIDNVSISDVHESGEPHEITITSGASMNNESLTSDGPLAPGSASTDAAADGSWDTLQPGAIITFTYTHTVTQAEFDAQ